MFWKSYSSYNFFPSKYFRRAVAEMALSGPAPLRESIGGGEQVLADWRGS